MRPILLLFFSVLAAVSSPRPAFAESRAEDAAQDALKKAETDYLARTYGAGGARLKKALKGCGANKCSAGVRAALYRDMGAMQFRKGQKAAANKSWAAALKLEPGLGMNPLYEAEDLVAAYAAAGGSVAPKDGSVAPKDGSVAPKGESVAPKGGSGGGGEMPSVGFSHAPAMEQRVNTPLPVYVEGGGSDVSRVVVQYKGSTMSGWKHIDLERVGAGWGGLVPCSDVTSGTMRYYVEGFDSQKAVVASSGDLQHPHAVPIKNELYGEEPTLPGMRAPAQCGGKPSDCPPGFPGCHKPSPEAQKVSEENEKDTEKVEEKRIERRRRFWVGLSGALDFMPLASGTDVCVLDRQTAVPLNSANYYCANADGTDFPTRSYPAMNTLLVPGKAGNVNGGVVLGNVRLMISLDYALTNNLLVGVRAGIVLFEYPGGQPSLRPTDSTDSASRDGRTGGVGRLHAEARGTFVFGRDPLAHAGVAPVVFAGLGVSEFDAHTSDTVSLSTPQSGPVNIWKTDGPVFLMVGGGLRLAMTQSLAATVAVRGNVAGLASGVVVTFGPELGVQYGF